MGFKKATWNFSEAGHGKSPADGIGGYVKNYANRAVVHRKDITNQFLNLFKDENVKIKVLEIAESDIKRTDNIVPNDLKAVKNTMLLHQLVWDERNCNQLSLYILSCFNCKIDPCSHFMAQPYLWSIKDMKQIKVQSKEVSGRCQAQAEKNDNPNRRFQTEHGCTQDIHKGGAHRKISGAHFCPA